MFRVLIRRPERLAQEHKTAEGKADDNAINAVHPRGFLILQTARRVRTVTGRGATQRHGMPTHGRGLVGAQPRLLLGSGSVQLNFFVRRAPEKENRQG